MFYKIKLLVSFRTQIVGTFNISWFPSLKKGGLAFHNFYDIFVINNYICNIKTFNFSKYVFIWFKYIYLHIPQFSLIRRAIYWLYRNNFVKIKRPSLINIRSRPMITNFC